MPRRAGLGGAQDVASPPLVVCSAASLLRSPSGKEDVDFLLPENEGFSNGRVLGLAAGHGQLTALPHRAEPVPCPVPPKLSCPPHPG